MGGIEKVLAEILLQERNDLKNDFARLQEENWRLKNTCKDLERVRKILHDELKDKCERELDQLKIQNKFLNPDNLFMLYCDNEFVFGKLGVLPIDFRNYPSNEILKTKIEKMSQHQYALLILAGERLFSCERMEKLKDHLENKNICILNEFLKYFACKSAESIVPYFPKFLNADGQEKKYAIGKKVKMNEYGEECEIINLYNFEFQFCDNCDCGEPGYCWYSDQTY